MAERIGRAKAIRLKCLDCTCDQPVEVRNCPCTDCPLWRFRMGREENDELKPQRKRGKQDFDDDDEISIEKEEFFEDED